MTTPPNRKVLLGLIGSGIQRSLTPAMQEQEAAHHGMRLHYQLIDLDRSGGSAEDLPLLLKAARMMGYAGLNITYPCKQAVIPHLDELSDEARAMGAVNTVVIRDGRLIGHNTDGSGWARGFIRALPEADLRCAWACRRCASSTSIRPAPRRWPPNSTGCTRASAPAAGPMWPRRWTAPAA